MRRIMGRLAPVALIAVLASSLVACSVKQPAPAGVQWTALAFPVGLLAVLFLAFQVVGDGARAALDPRTRRAP